MAKRNRKEPQTPVPPRPVSKPVPITGGVGFLLNHCGNLFAKDLNRRFRAVGIPLTSEQWLVMNRIEAHQGLTLSALSLLVRKDEASVSRIVQALVKKELMARTRNEDDRRSVTLMLTNAGQKLLKMATPEPRQTYKAAVAGLSKTEVDQAMNVVRKIIENLEGVQ